MRMLRIVPAHQRFEVGALSEVSHERRRTFAWVSNKLHRTGRPTARGKQRYVRRVTGMLAMVNRSRLTMGGESKDSRGAQAQVAIGSVASGRKALRSHRAWVSAESARARKGLGHHGSPSLVSETLITTGD